MNKVGHLIVGPFKRSLINVIGIDVFNEKLMVISLHLQKKLSVLPLKSPTISRNFRN